MTIILTTSTKYLTLHPGQSDQVAISVDGVNPQGGSYPWMIYLELGDVSGFRGGIDIGAPALYPGAYPSYTCLTTIAAAQDLAPGQYAIPYNAYPYPPSDENVAERATTVLYVTVTVASTRVLTVQHTAGGWTDPDTGNYDIPMNANQYVLAIPETGCRFGHWELDGNVVVGPGDGLGYSVFMDAPHTLKAFFILVYTVTVASVNGGTTSMGSGSFAYDMGTQVPIKAMPAAGYHFLSWTVTGNDGSDIPVPAFPDIVLNVTQSMTVTPHFEANPINTYQLNIAVLGPGNTNPSPGQYYYASGAVQQVSALSGAKPFIKWIVDGISDGTSTLISLTMDRNHDLLAVYGDQRTLTIMLRGNGSTSPPPGKYVYASNESAEVSATPQQGGTFVIWQLDGVDKNNSNPISVSMETDHTLTALFTGSGIISIDKTTLLIIGGAVLAGVAIVAVASRPRRPSNVVRANQ